MILARFALCLMLLALVGFESLRAETLKAVNTVTVTAARMIDVESGRVIRNPVITITDGRITAIVENGTATSAGGGKVYAFPGKTILPGLIDMHVHLTGLSEIGGYRVFKYADSFWGAVSVPNAKKTLDAGFTTVRNVGANDFQDVGLMQAIDGGWVPGPRIIPATWAIGATGGHCDVNNLPPSFDKGAPPSTINSPDEGRAKVRWLHKYGAEVIKICATGGVFSSRDSVGGQQLSFEEMKAIADEAHMLGLKVAAHAHGDEGIKTAILAGIDTIEHASLASEATLKLAAARHTWFSMDIYDDDCILADGTSNGTEQESLDKEAEIGLKQRQTFKRGVQLGVPMIFGTDASICPHGVNARQFAKMVEWGMTPLQAIQSATRNAAQALGKTADIGTIAVGRYGDLVIVSGDPLSDVRTLEHVDAVIKGGELVKAGL
jgi:imidazolonepropionase-like amidohydrolase